MNADVFYLVCQRLWPQDLVNFCKVFKNFQSLITDAFWERRIRSTFGRSDVWFPEKQIKLSDKAVRMERFAAMLEQKALTYKYMDLLWSFGSIYLFEVVVNTLINFAHHQGDTNIIIQSRRNVLRIWGAEPNFQTCPVIDTVSINSAVSFFLKYICHNSIMPTSDLKVLSVFMSAVYLHNSLR